MNHQALIPALKPLAEIQAVYIYHLRHSSLPIATATNRRRSEKCDLIFVNLCSSSNKIVRIMKYLRPLSLISQGNCETCVLDARVDRFLRVHAPLLEGSCYSWQYPVRWKSPLDKKDLKRKTYGSAQHCGKSFKIFCCIRTGSRDLFVFILSHNFCVPHPPGAHFQRRGRRQ